jgi:4-alpha-glucanotransferase
VTAVDGDLARLAEAHGVATHYDDQQKRRIEVSRESVVAVLAALGVDASSTEATHAALAEHAVAEYRRLVPPTVVVREGVGGHVHVHPPAGIDPSVTLHLEGGGVATDLHWLARHVEPVHVDGELVGTRTLVLPFDLPLGWHRLVVSAGGVEAEATVVVAPYRLELPEQVHRAWGWMVQLYAARSRASWGIGDLGDLAELARWSAGEGAGLLLVNPLHAVAPVGGQQPSPYFPGSRRFVNPIYLRVEDTVEYSTCDDAARRSVDALCVEDAGGLIERDAVWQAKLAALETLWAHSPRRTEALDRFREREGGGLLDFATWCALAEEHGPDWRTWPEPLRSPDSTEVGAARSRLAGRVEFYIWLQLLCDEQLAAAQDGARVAGMPIGVVHDLAVGADPAGADAWALQDVLATGTRIGAPPDTFNQLGQDWGMPPWHPARLAEVGYAPLRDMLRAVLRHAGGVRVDHVLGLFRLWWVPEGLGPAQGTYVRYDDDALLGVLALEAHRAGAIAIGEDLGTVEERMRKALADRGLLGSSVLWFERSEDPVTGQPAGLRPLGEWREAAAASVTTHDLPTAAGWLRGEHVRVRAELDQLAVPLEEEERRFALERAELLAFLCAVGLLEEGDDDEERIVLALHAALARSPSRLVLAALWDGLGDAQQPNLPGTTDEYPNWRLPLADGAGRQVLLEDLERHRGVARLASLLAAGVR